MTDAFSAFIVITLAIMWFRVGGFDCLSGLVVIMLGVLASLFVGLIVDGVISYGFGWNCGVDYFVISSDLDFDFAWVDFDFGLSLGSLH